MGAEGRSRDPTRAVRELLGGSGSGSLMSRSRHIGPGCIHLQVAEAGGLASEMAHSRGWQVRAGLGVLTVRISLGLFERSLNNTGSFPQSEGSQREQGSHAFYDLAPKVTLTFWPELVDDRGRPCSAGRGPHRGVKTRGCGSLGISLEAGCLI